MRARPPTNSTDPQHPNTRSITSIEHAMSRRRKHLEAAMAEDVVAPGEHQAIVRVVGSRGGNIVEVCERVCACGCMHSVCCLGAWACAPTDWHAPHSPSLR